MDREEARLRDVFQGRTAAVCVEGPQTLVALQQRAFDLPSSLGALLYLPADLAQLPLILEVLHI